MNNRYLYNKAILSKLSELVEKYPDLRFTQLLWNIGIFRWEEYKYNGDNNRIVDTHAEESKTTWLQMCENKFCFPQNKPDKKNCKEFIYTF